MKNNEKGKKIKKNTKSHKRKSKVREKNIKNSKPIESNFEIDCDKK